MDRLKKKCFAGSLAVHGSLLLVIIFGSAFLTSRHEAEPVITTFTMVNVTDGPTTTPTTAIEAPPPAEPISQPVQTPVEPEVVHVSEPVVHHSKPARQAEKRPEPKDQPREEDTPKDRAKDSVPETADGTLPKRPDKSKTDVKPTRTKTKPRHTTTVDLSQKVERRVNAPSTTDAADKAEAEANAKASAEQERAHRAALASSLRTAASTISTQGSTSTEIAMPGDAGPEFANYNQLIFSKYKLCYDREVLKAGEFASDNLSARVSITLTRDGKVIGRKLTSPSGNRALDKLVRQVLDEVKSVAPFPPETHDTERTFEIIFNLKPNRQI